MNKLLTNSLLALVLLGGATFAYADDTETSATITDGKYYLYDATNKLFLSRGANWGTEATVDKYGVPVKAAKLADGTYTLSTLDNSSTYVNATNGVYTDQGTYKWAITANDNGYVLSDSAKTNYLTHASGSLGEYATLTTDASAATTWKFLTKAERDAIVEAYPTENKSAVATAAGITGDFDTTIADYVSSVVKTIAPTEYTFAAVRSGSSASTGTPREVYQGTGNFTYSVTGLSEGIYKVSINALERDGWNGDNVTLADSGYYVTTSYLQAGDQQVRIKGWAEDRAGDNNPNSVSEAKTLFDAGKYSTDVYAYVSEDNGSLELKVAVPSFVNGHWFIMGNTVITLLKDGVTEEASDTLISTATKLESQTMNADTKTALTTAKTNLESDKTSKTYYQALSDAVTAAQTSADAYASAQTTLNERVELAKATNFYTADAYATYITTPQTALTNGTLSDTDAKAITDNTGWHNATQMNQFFGAAWGVTSYDGVPYVNTWSTEGNSDGSNFKTPFYEYWVADANTLGDKTLTGTITGLVPNGCYKLTADVRARLANSQTAPATGITMQVGDGSEATITGKQIGTSQLYLDTYTVIGNADADGNLTLKFNVASTNVSWLSFQHVKYEAYTPETVTIGDAGYVTYAATAATDYTKTSGLTAYKASYADNTITLTPITTAVPAGEAVVLAGDAAEYTLIPAATTPDALSDNALKASDGTVTGGSTVWVLTKKDNFVGFAPTAASLTIPAKKGYLEISDASATAKGFIAIGGGAATGINSVAAQSVDNGAVYNVAGQKVSSSYKGLVIKNGKKYLRK